MGIKICPKCEINFITDDERYCSVCRKTLKRTRKANTVEMCSVCGEHPVAPGEDMCKYCLHGDEWLDETDVFADGLLDGDDGLSMDDELVLSTDDIPDTELKEIHREFGMDEDDGDAHEDALDCGYGNSKDDDMGDGDDLDDERLNELGMHMESVDDAD